jgi:L-fucose/D-arabinose isomerase
MSAQVALANIVDGRIEFFEKRRSLVEEEMKALDWIRKEFECVESEMIHTDQDIKRFVEKVRLEKPKTLIIHIPIWAEPVLAVKLYNEILLPVMLLGNSRPETSSMVGILGSGGALDQMGCEHIRIFDHNDQLGRKSVEAFIRAANAISQLRGQTLGRFGGRSLGIVTADIDPNQWQKLFGVNVETIDQQEIVDTAEVLEQAEVDRFSEWMQKGLGKVEYNGLFTPKAFERQVRSYLATLRLIEQYNLDFVAVKCQPELSDGYVTQCVAHMLLNGTNDAYGSKKPVVHACESDADGALTMQLLKLITDDKPAALLDVRWYDKIKGTWTLANCGALPLDFFSADEGSGLSEVSAVPHTFGKGGGGAYTGIAKPQQVTLARLCRKNGEYRMSIVAGCIVKAEQEDLAKTTSAFPKALVKTNVDNEFLDYFGSNHIHMAAGDCMEELVMLCRLMNIEYKLWR